MIFFFSIGLFVCGKRAANALIEMSSRKKKLTLMGLKLHSETFVSCHVSAVPSSRISLISVLLALPFSFSYGELLTEAQVPTRG